MSISTRIENCCFLGSNCCHKGSRLVELMSQAEFLFSEYRRKVLALLLLNPDEQFHQREIARRTQTISGTLGRELAKMVDANVLVRLNVGNQAHYRANRDCLIYEELASILRKTEGWVETLAKSLATLPAVVQTAFVFGSMASGKQTNHSDIDLLVIGDVGFGELVSHLYPLQETLGREINPNIYQVSEWQALVKEGGAFVRDVLGRPKVFLKGGPAGLAAAGEQP
jgi:predicted nucleotidyltransferase